MAYIGTSPSNGIRRVNTFTATANQTSFSVVYADTNYIDVHQNGVLLATDDYTSTTGTTVVLAQGASADDVVVITVYDVFSVADTVSKTAGGTFDNTVTFLDDIIIGDGKNIGSASDVDAIAIASNGVVTFSQKPVFSSGGSGSMQLILTTDVSAGDASVIFNSTYITTAYRSYQLIISGYEPVTDGTQLRLHPSIDNGSNFVAGITKGQLYVRTDGAGTQTGVEIQSAAASLGVGGAIGNDDTETASYVIDLVGLTSAVHKKQILFNNQGKHANESYRWAGGATIPTTSAINYIKLASSSGNITAGRFSLYGIES